MTRTRTVAVAIGLAVTASGALAGCGQPDVTKDRLERAIGPAFANLYVQRADLLGEHGITVQTIGASTACDRGGPKLPDVGPGPDWICMIHFTDDHGQPQDGKFEVQVRADATYIAGGPSKLIGQATLTDSHGHDVPNPVFEWDGAFDPDN
ncbi:hypothetical protein [Micromonospora sp. NPDC047738]|uniref:hypothetical protein n=1 Tax=unclassified Micromonospora TaxID=2617518 RepID=UPI0033E14FA5